MALIWGSPYGAGCEDIIFGESYLSSVWAALACVSQTRLIFAGMEKASKNWYWNGVSWKEPSSNDNNCILGTGTVAWHADK